MFTMNSLLRNLTPLLQIKNKFYNHKTCKLHLLECDGKELLRKFGVNIQEFITINKSDNIKSALENIKFKTDEYVIKSQILSGGRYLGVFENGFKSGVHITKQTKDIENIVTSMLGHRLITKQTPKNGSLVNKVMVAKSIKIRRETYISIMLNSSHNGPIIIASPTGGTDIENNSNNVKMFPIDIIEGVTQEKATDVANYLGFDSRLHNVVIKQIIAIWNTFIQTDALLIEINPFVETYTDEIIAVDVKTIFDDNALFRQDQITKLEEENKDIDKLEYQASKNNLNYIRLDGNIGCLVNGAGLAMATMDIIKLYGGNPANFLDIGGSANKQQVTNAIKILLNDENVKTILINIFGGIVNCKIIADGIIDAMKTSELHVPLIIRMKGNHVEEAKLLLFEYDKHIKIQFADNLQEAAQLAIKGKLET